MQIRKIPFVPFVVHDLQTGDIEWMPPERAAKALRLLIMTAQLRRREIAMSRLARCARLLADILTSSDEVFDTSMADVEEALARLELLHVARDARDGGRREAQGDRS
jgi:hypothetical protein